MDREQETCVQSIGGEPSVVKLRHDYNWQGITQENVFELGFRGLSVHRLAAMQCSLSAIMAASAVECDLHYSRRNDSYAGQQRYQGEVATLSNTRSNIEALVGAGFIEEVRGRSGRKGYGCESRVRATPKLVEYFDHWSEPRFVLREPIHLKDCDKRRTDYVDNEITHAFRRDMVVINEALATINVRIAGQIDDAPELRRFLKLMELGQRLLYRVFNGDFEHGGRAYASFQNLRKQQRRRLMIDGNATDEPDFAQLHPQLLYAKCGVDIDGDAYTVTGVPRQLAKPAWQILMNCSSKPRAILAFAKHLKQKGQVATQAEAMALAKAVLEALEARHESVQRAFYSGIGLRLQRVDSDLMIRVMLRVLGAGYIALPIHDSFIVPRGGAADAVRMIMAEELDNTLRGLRACTR